jgi:proteic killer suppression protein
MNYRNPSLKRSAPEHLLTLALLHAVPTVARCATWYDYAMITSFRHKGLRQFFETGSTACVQANHAKRLRLQLVALDTAQVIDDMDIPGFRLHPLKGEMKGRWSITVHGNWRITFEFKDGNANVLDYEDYH